jgi:hypothetical protein
LLLQIRILFATTPVAFKAGLSYTQICCKNAYIFLLTAGSGQTTISLALNKKSAQKQKRQTINNGFSQAVVSFITPVVNL